MAIPSFPPTSYGIVRTLPSVSVDEALARVRAALAAEGFGVLTEIDLQATLRAKLGVEERPYTILGACAPPIALRALSEEPGIGLLLPCNVVVSADDGGGSVVAAIDPVAMFAMIGRPEVEPLACEVRDRLRRALDACLY